MYEENLYEPLAEVFLSLDNNLSTQERIYCLCSRVVISNSFEEPDVNKLPDESGGKFTYEEEEVEPTCPTYIQPASDLPFLGNSTTLAKPKEHEEAVSCYCSASHCSTDEHDSIGGGRVGVGSGDAALHSDSGADLSESSRDLDWERYWSTNGERIVWESWIEKFGEFVDPSYLKNQSTESVCRDQDETNEDTQFNVDHAPVKSEKKASFSGVLSLDSINEERSSSAEDIIDNFSESSEISTGGCEDNFRLRSGSRSSGKSSLLTDSLTNVTPITIYSSEHSCSAEESSVQSTSNSFISSADSVSSNELQWQQLWIDHFNELYQSSYLEFHSKTGPLTPPSIDQDCTSTIDDRSVTEDSTQEVTVVSVVQQDCKSGVPVVKQRSSVGYLLSSLRAMSMDQTDFGASLEDISLDMPLKDDTNQNSDNGSSHELPQSVECDEPEEVSWKSTTNRKRGHDNEPDLDRVKSAFKMMGFVYDNESSPSTDPPSQIQKGHVVYRKRNIRSHNRTLNMKALKCNVWRSHVKYDDEGQPCVVDKVKCFLENNYESDNLQTAKPEVDNFSEKDDSLSSDECDVVYSAEESVVQQKPPGKRKKKRVKRKSNTAWPQEIRENPSLKKYWCQRYRLFSKFDEGIKLDQESWYSVTPEKVSKHTAERCQCDLIVDACCGAGGNSIQFAFTCERVIAIDIDPVKINLAKHNAKVYGVEDRIEFIVGDFMTLANDLYGDVVFLSPPWGGPEYMTNDSYDLDSVPIMGGGRAMYEAAAKISPNIAMYLPKNINTDQLVKMAGPGGSVEVEQNFLEKKLIAVTAYFGELVEEI